MNLMKILSIIISKTVHNIVKLVKGSTSHIGGVIALKIDKNILSKLQKPEVIITVTGTNRKNYSNKSCYRFIRTTYKWAKTKGRIKK